MSSKEKTIAKCLGLAMLPAAAGSFAVALRFPDATERLYTETLYPIVARGFSILRSLPFSLAEPLAFFLLSVAALCFYRWFRRPERRLWRALAATWIVAGFSAVLFLILWGFNYARPSLGSRLELSREDVDAAAALDAGRRTARMTARLYEEMAPTKAPTKLPFDFHEMNQRLDEAYRRLRLPGDPIRFRPAPAKRLWSSTLVSYLGISGIFIPFTGEPSINALQPDAALPLVVAHEKAHQRGVTDEGEANFAAFLACSQETSSSYFRYAAYLFATRYLLGEASYYLPPEDIRAAWELLGDGPTKDVLAIRNFWKRYEGPASSAASRVNDRYLRTMQVPHGLQSYGTVVTLLVALDRKGDLTPE